MKNKLIDLLYEGEEKCEYTDCGQCDYLGRESCGFHVIADHLIANGVTIQKWIPVSERLPERNTEVLVCDTREYYVSVWEYMGDGLWFGNGVIWATEDVTHWMPLPEMPKEDK